MTKQEHEVQLAALAREKENEKVILGRLSDRLGKAEERGDEAEASRLKLEQNHHTEILKAVERELANAGGSAQTRQSRAVKRPAQNQAQKRA